MNDHVKAILADYVDCCVEILRKDIDNWKEAMADAVGEYSDGVRFALEHFTFVLDSLQQEQPEVDLKNQIQEWVNLMVGASFPEQDGDYISEEDYRNVIRQTACHFYELGLYAKEELK